MTRRVALVLAAAALLAAVAAPAAAQDLGWTIEAYDVDIIVAEDGAFTVIEEIAVDFGALEHRGIYREIPVRYRYDDERDRVVEIDRWSVTTSDGTPDDVQITERHADVEVRIGDPDTYITGRHTYRITYRVRGALNRFDTHDELFWEVTGHGWGVPIETARATVVGAPIEQVTCFAGRAGSTQLCERARAEAGSSMAEFEVTGLGPREGLSVVVAFTPGAVDVPPPLLEYRWSPERAFIGSPFAIPLAVLVAIAALAWFVRLLAREGRDRVTRGGRSVDGRLDDESGVGRRWVNPRDVPVRFRPPDGLRPAQLGVIVDERVDPVEVSATIVDLAVRGYLTIREEETRRLFRSRSEWQLTRRPDPEGDELRPYEQRLLDGLFEDRDDDEVLTDLIAGSRETYEARRDSLGSLSRRLLDRVHGVDGDGEGDDEEERDEGRGDAAGAERDAAGTAEGAVAEVALSELAGEFHRDYRAIRDLLYRDAVARGWFTRSPKATRDRWVAIGLAITLGGVALAWFLALATTFAIAAVPLVPLGLAVVVAHRWMPHRTPQGSRVLDETLGFREFISTAERGRAEFAEEEGIFTRYLPYAVLFGVTDRWARAFEHLGAAAAASEAGVWYVGPGGSFPDVGRLSAGVSDMSSIAGSSLPQTPASSGSSGFSGGGSVGGGFGGGGGGGW